MGMTDAVLEHRTKLDGRLLLFIYLDMLIDGFRSDGRTGLVAYHIVQSGITCRLPRTPRSTLSSFLTTHDVLIIPPIAPRSLARHYFDESISDAHSEGPVTDEPHSARSAFSMMSELMTPFGDISPEAL
jgi:hypothetical protein